MLDPPGFSGHNVSFESFAMGIPVVAWANAPFLRGRFTLGLYRTMALTDCLADSADGFVDIAWRLVHDGGFRAAMRRAIADRSPAIFDDLAVVRAHEAFWTQAVERSRAEIRFGKG